MQRYKYRAINKQGRPVRGIISASNEVDLSQQLDSVGLELVRFAVVKESKGGLINFSRIKTRDLIQFYGNMDQMQGAGIPMLSALSDVRDSTENDTFRDILSTIHRDVSDGSSLSEAMASHPKVFNNLQRYMVASGEETGDLKKVYKNISSYLRWVDALKGKLKKATNYPLILLGVILVTITVMMGFVVPQILEFLLANDLELPGITIALINTSNFVRDYWWAILLGLAMIVVGVIFLRRTSYEFAYRTDAMFLQIPVIGMVMEKITIARFAQTFSSLYSSGIDVLNCLMASRNTVSNRVIGEALDNAHTNVKNGKPLSEALKVAFPSLIIRMLKIGEESGNLSEVLDQVVEFYSKDVDEAVENMITMIEPMLTAVLGGMILWIAAAVFGPIYNSFSELNF